MEIIEQSHEILIFPQRPLQDIEMVARTCYKSENRITETSAVKLVERLNKLGHTAMIEFGDIWVRFITDRGVTHELVRHRLCSFAQESTRYVDYAPTKDPEDVEMQFIRPQWMNPTLVGTYYDWDHIKDINSFITDLELDWLEAMKETEDRYRRRRILGDTPERARTILPNSLKTEINVKANFTEWKHIFRLRTSEKAHPQMTDLMRPLEHEFNCRLPEIFQ